MNESTVEKECPKLNESKAKSTAFQRLSSQCQMTIFFILSKCDLNPQPKVVIEIQTAWMKDLVETGSIVNSLMSNFVVIMIISNNKTLSY